MRLFKLYYLFVITLLCNTASAQDPHFSQFYASPLSLNPALTGMVPGDFRASAIYRSQWASVATPFTTAGASFDIKILPSVVGTENILGLGISALNDASNNGALKANYLSFSLAYNKQLDDRGNFRLGLGLQTTLTNKTVDYSKLTFSQQFTPFGFNINNPNGEPLPGFSLNYMDYHAGLLLSGKDDDKQAMWNFGASVFHIGKPNETVSGYNNQLNRRYTLHGMYNNRINDRDRLYFSALYMNSSIKEEYMLGLVYSINIDDEADEESIGRSFLCGSWYRVGDAVVPYVGLQLNSIKAGLSYDINVSSLTAASNYRGGFELTLLYNFIETENMRIKRKTLCPTKGSYTKWFGF